MLAALNTTTLSVAAENPVAPSLSKMSRDPVTMLLVLLRVTLRNPSMVTWVPKSNSMNVVLPAALVR